MSWAGRRHCGEIVDAVPSPPPDLNDIRAERALHEELDFLAAGAGLEYLTLGLFKRANELLADDLALTFRLGDAHALRKSSAASTVMSLMPVAATKSCA